MASLQDIMKKRKKGKQIDVPSVSLDDSVQIADLLADKVFTEKFQELRDYAEKLERKQGETGLQGEKGDKGEPGKDGANGRDGVDGLPGKDGKDGKPGADGKHGKDGKHGTDGLNGEHGLDGKDGEKGEDGSPDTAEEVVDKVNSIKEGIEQSSIKGFEQLIKNLSNSIRNAKGKGGSGGGGGGSMSFENISSDTTINPNAGLIRVDTTNGNVTVTLPPASQMARRELHIKKIDSSNNKVTIQPQNSETIDDETSIDILTNERSLRLYSTGTTFDII